MFSFTVLYPYGEGKKFDWDYYLPHHIEAIKQGLGPRLKQHHIEKGLAGMAPNTPPTYFCILHVLVDNMEDIEEIGKMAPMLLADVPNYTDVQPIIQISEFID